MKKVFCPHCYTPIESYAPVEPMFELPVAAMYLGMSVSHVRQWLGAHKEVPKLYRKDPARRLHRLLPASWVQYIQGQRVFVRPAKGEKLRKLGGAYGEGSGGDPASESVTRDVSDADSASRGAGGDGPDAGGLREAAAPGLRYRDGRA
jgi:hypothetical protein